MIIRKSYINRPVWRSSDPFAELDRLRRELERFTDSTSTGLSGEASAGVYPLVNITEEKDTYYVRAELPGIKAEELDISIANNNLSIEGEHKITTNDENVKYHRREREPGKFSRTISLPAQIDSSKAEAKCSDGILTVDLPKAESAKPKQIKVVTK